ncbi:hypothetical protein ADUPG1_008989 [Aduncisulcus paluster]|uniref:Reverse transcriptase domain-containing protein n=1 Tax=Aduncisulcus paluster TaxID=2918883 RepID=A0ABQ5KTZ9_9EUKA|nr:hypothetical protein ADUPG1_008989 [Aduncisulcus paluster]
MVDKTFHRNGIKEENCEPHQIILIAITTPSTSPWAFPVVMVPKRDGTKRMCIDYVKLNEVTTPIRHPLPKMDETLDQLAGATIFGSMDLRNGFFQIKMSPESMKYTSFVTYNGQFEWKRMPFGLHIQEVEEIASHYGRVGSPLEKKLIRWKDRIKDKDPKVLRVYCLGFQVFMDGVAIVRNAKTSVLATKSSITRKARVKFQWIWEHSTLPDTKECRVSILNAIKEDILTLQRGILTPDGDTVIGYLSCLTADTSERTKILGLHPHLKRCQICEASGLGHPRIIIYHMPHDYMHLEVLRIGSYMLQFLEISLTLSAKKEIRKLSQINKIVSPFEVHPCASGIILFLSKPFLFLPFIAISNIFSRFTRASENVSKMTDCAEKEARVKCISELEDLMEQVSREKVREMLQDEEEEKKRKRREQTHQIVDELEEEDELEKEPESSRSPQIGERLPTRVTRCEAPILDESQSSNAFEEWSKQAGHKVGKPGPSTAAPCLNSFNVDDVKASYKFLFSLSPATIKAPKDLHTTPGEVESWVGYVENLQWCDFIAALALTRRYTKHCLTAWNEMECDAVEQDVHFQRQIIIPLCLHKKVLARDPVKMVKPHFMVHLKQWVVYNGPLCNYDSQAGERLNSTILRTYRFIRKQPTRHLLAARTLPFIGSTNPLTLGKTETVKGKVWVIADDERKVLVPSIVSASGMVSGLCHEFDRTISVSSRIVGELGLIYVYKVECKLTMSVDDLRYSVPMFCSKLDISVTDVPDGELIVFL